MLTVFCDGGARGNPGPAAIGAVILSEKINHKISEYIGEATNNQAEYQAIIAALKWLTENCSQFSGDLEVECLLDSELVVEQLNGRYKVKNEGLKPFYDEAQEILRKLNHRVNFRHIKREKNQEADKLVNLALDKATKK